MRVTGDTCLYGAKILRNLVNMAFDDGVDGPTGFGTLHVSFPSVSSTESVNKVFTSIRRHNYCFCALGSFFSIFLPFFLSGIEPLSISTFLRHLKQTKMLALVINQHTL